jgi:CYTH domain-containing protein
LDLNNKELLTIGSILQQKAIASPTAQWRQNMTGSIGGTQGYLSVLTKAVLRRKQRNKQLSTLKIGERAFVYLL